MAKKKDLEIGDTRCLWNPRTKKEHLQEYTGEKPFSWKFKADEDNLCNKKKRKS